MTQLVLQFNDYVLQLDYEHTAIHLRLAPSKASSAPSYTYSANIDAQYMDARIGLIFNSISNLWKYLSFYQEKAIAIDFSHIVIQNESLVNQNINNSLHISDLKQTQIPVALKLILLQDVETIITLNGNIEIDTLEKKLAKSLQDNEELKEKLSASCTYANSLQQKIQQLKSTIENYEAERLRINQDEPPRKKIHLSEDIEEGQYTLHISQNKELHRPNGHHSYENLEKTQTKHSSKKLNSVNSNSSQDQVLWTSQNVEQSKVNGESNQENRITCENSSYPNIEKKAEPEKSKSLNNDCRKSNNNEDLCDQPAASQSEQVKKITEFAQKCYLFVGYNDKSEERKGYVCIGCSKAFKDISYLEKHLISKHVDLAESSQRELEIKLGQFKQKKENDTKLENALKYYGAQK